MFMALTLEDYFSSEEGGLSKVRTNQLSMLESYQCDKIVLGIGRKDWSGRKCDLVDHVGKTILGR